MRCVLALALLGTALSGCFGGVLPVAPVSRLEFTCAVLDPGEAERLVVESWRGDGVDLPVGDAQGALTAELNRIGARDGGVILRTEDGPPVPRGGWNVTTMREWHADQPFPGGNEVRLRVLWVASLGSGQALLEAAPGLVAVSQAAIREGAARLGVPEADVARAVLLHAAGHALGAVNRGIPVQDPDIQEREGPPGHDPDPASVMHVGWEDAVTMAWVADAPYDSYSADLHADWAAAVEPGGVCAP